MTALGLFDPAAGARRSVPFPPSPLRYSADDTRRPRRHVAPYGHSEPDFVLYAHGRAHRVLAHLATGAFSTGQIVSATAPGLYTRKIERRRTDRICKCMARAGLTEIVPGYGWTATAAGRDALACLEADIAATNAVREPMLFHLGPDPAADPERAPAPRPTPPGTVPHRPQTPEDGQPVRTPEDGQPVGTPEG